jgi:Uma2 family endonuclease
MVSPVPRNPRTQEPQYMGLRLDADTFFQLEDDGHKYELLHGVVVVSPSPDFTHQLFQSYLLEKLRMHARTTRAGVVVNECDVQLAPDVAYRPDIIFIAKGRLGSVPRRITIPPDLVVELISPSSRNYDLRTKRDDYEAAGVREYWAIDVATLEASQFVLRDSAFVTRQLKPGDRLTSETLAGFSFVLSTLREAIDEV